MPPSIPHYNNGPSWPYCYQETAIWAASPVIRTPFVVPTPTIPILIIPVVIDWVIRDSVEEERRRIRGGIFVEWKIWELPIAVPKVAVRLWFLFILVIVIVMWWLYRMDTHWLWFYLLSLCCHCHCILLFCSNRWVSNSSIQFNIIIMNTTQHNTQEDEVNAAMNRDD